MHVPTMLPFVMKTHTLQDKRSRLSHNFPLWVAGSVFPTWLWWVDDLISHAYCLCSPFCTCDCLYSSLTDKGKCSTVTVTVPFDPPGVWQSSGRRGASTGQEVTETQVSLRPCCRLHFRHFCRAGLPVPAAPAVVGTRPAHGHGCGCHRPKRAVEGE